MNTNGGEDGCDNGASVEEMLQDRMKGVAWEINNRKAATTTEAPTLTKKSKKQKTDKKKEPTREHLLVREYADKAMKWEVSMRAKHTEGQAAEMMDRIYENVGKAQFPTQPFYNWTEELMEEAKIGWDKCKAFEELLVKYPTQYAEQMYFADTNEWVMR